MARRRRARGRNGPRPLRPVTAEDWRRMAALNGMPVAEVIQRVTRAHRRAVAAHLANERRQAHA